MQEELREERLRKKNDEHRRFGFGEDEDSQKEAKGERLRANKERHRRMGYEEMLPQNNMSSSMTRSFLIPDHFSSSGDERKVRQARWQGFQGAFHSQ